MDWWMVGLVCLGVFFGQGPPMLYEEDIAASNPGRSEQAKELEAYVRSLRDDDRQRRALFQPDYSSPQAYEKSAAKLRQGLRDSLGYPPPGEPEKIAPEFRQVGEDSLGVYYKTKFAVLPGVHIIGMYIVPKAKKGKLPLVVSMHGGGGSPEVATFHGGANYHDMVRGAVKEGYAVWAPQHLFSADGFPGDIRQKIDVRARLVGTTITAIEIAKIARGLDVLLKRPEIDKNRVAMVGLSYGGLYTLYTTALEPRIKVAVSSCYFSDQASRMERQEPNGLSDVRFWHGLSRYRDSDAAALICPRPLEIQMGRSDPIFPIEESNRAAPPIAEHYRRLGIPDKFHYFVFEGSHEWYDKSAWEFLRKHL